MGRNFIRAGIAGLMLGGAMATPLAAEGLAGPYLAATAANLDNNFTESGRYYVQALAANRSDGFLMQNALVSFIATGDFGVAVNIAKTARATGMENLFADLVATVDAVNRGDYAAAKASFPKTDDQISPLLGQLMRAWIAIGNGETSTAIAAFDVMDQNETLALYGRYHKALALAYTGDYAAAADILDGTEGTPLHLNTGSIIAHVQILSTLGRNADALAILDGATARGFSNETLQNMREKLVKGETLAFTQVDSPAYGMAEALVTMAEALSRSEPSRLALVYARLARQLRPDNVDAIMIVADILERLGQYDLAGQAYASVPRTSEDFKSASIGRAEVLRKSGDTPGAIKVLEKLAQEYPDNVSVLNGLGDIYRGDEQFEKAIEAYDRAIALLDNPPAPYWVVYYARAISESQLDRWPEAEADLRKALELSPDQPQVLNYLGYSFLERRSNLDEAQKMIETAAQEMPQSGAIIDSLGWMFYRLGKYEQALEPMQRAVKLLPVDPIINDHYGDVLWMVGRKREARFQWQRALSFDPEPQDAERIRRKLDIGLDKVLAEEDAK